MLSEKGIVDNWEIINPIRRRRNWILMDVERNI